MNDTKPNSTSQPDRSVLEVIGGSESQPLWRRPLLWLIVGAVVVIGIGAYAWRSHRAAGVAPTFVTERLAKGDITLTITANGTLQPTRSVNIGSELSGTVSRVFVDVNDRVKQGQVLVELDTAKLSDQVMRSRASLAVAKAQVAQAVATLKEAQSTLARLEEVSVLSSGKVPSASELDAARASVQRAISEEASANAGVQSAQASLSTDETNLRKASIRSPIDGVILTRAVDPGNAVAASLQAVTLFTIAEDLKQLRLQVNVDEADVGAAAVGQDATFTVSAYPGRHFPAKVTRVAYGSTITDNVVTYVTYLDVDNSDLSLRPGMTGTATIVATERKGVLLVPNTALRFTPALNNGASTNANTESGGLVSSLVPRMPGRGPRRSAGNSPNTAAKRTLWILRDNAPVAVSVTLGITDGRMTEVTSGDVQADMDVIVDQRASQTT